MMTPDEVKKVYPFDKALEFKKRGLNPTHPEAIGVVEGGDTWMQHAMANGPLLEKIPENVQAAMDKVASVTGRQYHLFDYAGAADADRVIVVMGASASTVEETVNYLNQHGEKVGVMKVHLWRPFSLKHFQAALPKTVKKICVLDKTREDAAYGDPLYEDVCAVANDMEQKVTVVGGRFGVGGKQFTPTMAKAAFDNLKADKPRNHFCLGIVDDVCHSNLPLGPTLNVSPKHLKQCILYGLGSDGTVGATQEAVKLIVDNTKLNAQAYFGFDAHKSGGLTVTHLRFGPDKITSEYNIENADYIGCHATGYVSKFDMLQNIKEGGTFVLNAPWKTVEELEKNLPPALKHQIAEKKVKFYVIDASAVAQKVGLRQRINMVMQAVFFKLSAVLPEAQATELIANNIRTRYAKKGDEVVNMNIQAMEQAGHELHQVDYPASWLNCKMEPLRVFDASVPDAFKNLYYPTTLLEGDKFPVSTFTPGGVQETNTSQYEKRGFAVNVPVWNKDTCTQCNQCSLMCPHAVIRPFLLDAAESKKAPASFATLPAAGDELKGLNFRIQMSPLDCTGCEVCANVCPTQSLTMKPLSAVRDVEAKNWEFAMTLTNKGHLVDKTTVKGLAFQPPMLEFNGACAGCGEMTIVKMLTQLYGDRIMFADAMGCTMVSLGGTGVVPFTRNQRGHGPTWGCSLFEDNADYGYGMYKSQVVRRNKLTAYVEQALASSAPMSQELRAAMQKWYDHRDDADAAIASYDELLPLLKAEKDKAVEIKNVNDYADMLPLHTTWILGGDGWAYDIGFNALDHVMASGDNIKCMVVDTEMYANTGGQQSKATQLSAVAKFAAGGKRMMKKDLGKHMMGYKNVYVASIAVGADPRQAIKALIEAQTYNGPALVISYSPCQQHGFPSKLGMSHLAEEERKAVECGYWPLYRYDPRRAEKGENPFQLDFKKLKGKVVDYLNGQNRYSVLERQHPEVADKLHEELQVELEKRHAERVRMAMSDKQLWKELNKTYGKK